MSFKFDPDAVLHRYTKALWVALGYRDSYTRIHSERVLALCANTGVRAGLAEAELTTLRISAAIHDVGKIGIPDQILLKPGRLDDGESIAMKRHCEIGARIALAIDLAGAEEIARVIRHHHEDYNGRGYPDGLAGEQIPVPSRIIRIADSYDAMAMARPYHPAKCHNEIIDILQDETPEKHDPTLMAYFRQIVEHSEYRSTGC